MRLTEAQRVSLRCLGLVGDSQRMPHFQSRGLASLVRRGLAENVGGRGRDARIVLTPAGRELLALRCARCREPVVPGQLYVVGPPVVHVACPTPRQTAHSRKVGRAPLIEETAA
jgi:hypothetical protein